MFKYTDFVIIFRENYLESVAIDKCINFCERKSRKTFKTEELKSARQKIRNLLLSFRRKWRAKDVHRTWNSFLAKHENWLKRTMELSITDELQLEKVFDLPGPGRPTKSFDECAQRAKRQKISETVNSLEISTNLMMAVAQKVAMKEKKQDTAKVLKIFSQNENHQELLKVLQNPLQKLTPTQALALYYDSNQSKNSYTQLKKIAKAQNADIFPSYQEMAAEKLCWYPEGNILRNYNLKILLI